MVFMQRSPVHWLTINKAFNFWSQITINRLTTIQLIEIWFLIPVKTRKHGQSCSHFTLSQSSEIHHRSRSHFATPMTVLYKSWANVLGLKWSNWNTKFARIFFWSDCEKRPKIPRNFLIERQPWMLVDVLLTWSRHKHKPAEFHLLVFCVVWVYHTRIC